MNYLEIILISIGLAMDCFAVSFSAGATQVKLTLKNALVLGLFFGFFQAIMPLIGWAGGAVVVEKISHIDHWITFGILGFLGGKMIIEAIWGKEDEQKQNIMKLGTLLILSIATSIDALAVGFSFALANVNIWITILCIGIASFLFSLFGVYAGKKLCHFIKSSYAEILGGIILISIGIKILLEHLLL